VSNDTIKYLTIAIHNIERAIENITQLAISNPKTTDYIYLELITSLTDINKRLNNERIEIATSNNTSLTAREKEIYVMHGKTPAIMVLRERTGLGIKEAYELVEQEMRDLGDKSNEG
jgi:ribosomal protein L7/L12